MYHVSSFYESNESESCLAAPSMHCHCRHPAATRHPATAAWLSYRYGVRAGHAPRPSLLTELRAGAAAPSQPRGLPRGGITRASRAAAHTFVRLRPALPLSPTSSVGCRGGAVGDGRGLGATTYTDPTRHTPYRCSSIVLGGCTRRQYVPLAKAHGTVYAATQEHIQGACAP
jgi:hypothetical protein